MSRATGQSLYRLPSRLTPNQANTSPEGAPEIAFGGRVGLGGGLCVVLCVVFCVVPAPA